MKASEIWNEFIAGKISTKQAFDAINDRLGHCNDLEKISLLKLSERILDREVPLVERNYDAERAFQASTMRRESED